MKQIYQSFNFKRFLLVAIAIDLLLFTAGCTTSWVSEASSIVALLGPAISSALEILAAFGVGLSPAVATQVASWGAQAQTALGQISELITQYNSALAAAQPGILAEIQTLITTITNDLNNLLPTLHITDAATQAKVIAVFDAILAELQGLANLMPVIQGKVTDHDEAKVLISKVKSAKQFAHDFNKKAGALDKRFQIKGPGVVSDIKHVGE